MVSSPKKLLIGAHTSAAGGAYNALREGEKIGASTIQLFTANQKQWKGKPLSEEAIEKWEVSLEETGLEQIMSHASYLINLGCPKQENLLKSRHAFSEEIHRCQQLGITYLNFHPGAALDSSKEQCLDTIVASLLGFAKQLEKGTTRLLLETTAGQGSTVGDTFEDLAYIIQKTKKDLPIGVCIDTCHIFAAGYDIRTKKAWDKTLKYFDTTVGLEHLYAFHLNDSMKALGSRRDRHAHLGKGEIGIEAFSFLMTDPRTKWLPKYLETPGGPGQWVDEIALLRSFAEQKKG